MNNANNLPAADMISPFKRIRRTNAAGAEYWSSRDFAGVRRGQSGKINGQKRLYFSRW